MNRNKFPQEQNQKIAGGPRPTSAAPVNQSEINFAPSPDEVARRAYFAFENQGSVQGQHVQHWLAAEAELIAERKVTRTHGFQHHPHKNSSTSHVEAHSQAAK
jgi:hypothetical protein